MLITLTFVVVTILAKSVFHHGEIEQWWFYLMYGCMGLFALVTAIAYFSSLKRTPT